MENLCRVKMFDGELLEPEADRAADPAATP
jgi:hypothetical protein